MLMQPGAAAFTEIRPQPKIPRAMTPATPATPIFSAYVELVITRHVVPITGGSCSQVVLKAFRSHVWSFDHGLSPHRPACHPRRDRHTVRERL